VKDVAGLKEGALLNCDMVFCSDKVERVGFIAAELVCGRLKDVANGLLEPVGIGCNDAVC